MGYLGVCPGIESLLGRAQSRLPTWMRAIDSEPEHQLNSYMAFYLHRSTPRSIRVAYNSANR
ncbi:MAG: hypothetical protein ABW185_22610, partial [Sedimenticola sp.]